MSGGRAGFEFVDPPAGDGPAGADVLDLGPGRPPRRAVRRPGRGRLVAAGVAVAVVAVGAVTAVGLTRGSGATVPAPATPSPGSVLSPPRGGGAPVAVADAVVGPVGLPRGIGSPRQIVAPGTDDDVVFVLDRGSGIARVQRGRVTATTLLEAPVTALAVAPDGSAVFAAVAGDTPQLQALDGRTLANGRSAPTRVPLQTLVDSGGSVIGLGTGALLQFDPRTLSPTGETALPGVITATAATVDDRGQVSALVTTGTDGARRLFAAPGAGAPVLGPAVGGALSYVGTSVLDWLASPGPGGVTQLQGWLGARPVVAVGDRLPGGSTLGAAVSGRTSFVSVQAGSAVVRCWDAGGQEAGSVDLAAQGLTGGGAGAPVLKTAEAVYALVDAPPASSSASVAGSASPAPSAAPADDLAPAYTGDEGSGPTTLVRAGVGSCT